MSDRIILFFSGIVRDPYLLCAIFTAMPITEIKGALLYAAVAKVRPLFAFLICLISSFILCAVLCFFAPRFLRLVERYPKIKAATSFLIERAEEKATKIKTKEIDGRMGRKMFGLFAFVALPLPLTGVWAGALLAAVLRLDYKNSLFALSLGNFAAGGIVLFVALVAGDRAPVVFNGFLVFALVLFLFAVGKWAINRFKSRRAINGK